MPNQPIRLWSGPLPLGHYGETVFDGEHGFRLVIFNPTDGSCGVQEAFEAGDKIYEPMRLSLVEKGTVILAAEPQEYGDEVALHEAIRNFIDRYVFLGDSPVATSYLRQAGLYVQLTWIYEQVKVLPYLRVLGPPGSGKTRFLEVVGSLCYRFMNVSGCLTAAALFRMIDVVRGTMAVDEADFQKSDLWTEITKVLNVGYRQSGTVIRNVGEGRNNYVPAAFNVYCPKLLGTRRRFADDALESRCLTHQMPQGRDGRPLHLPQTFFQEAQQLRNQLLLWRLRQINRPWEWNEALLPENLEPRLAEIGHPLLHLASSEEMRETIRDALLSYQETLQADRSTSIEADVVEVIVSIRREKVVQAETTDGHGLTDLNPTVGEVTKRLNSALSESDEKHDSRNIGRLIRASLYLKTKRVSGGTVILSQDGQLDELKKKYGIQDEHDEDDDEHRTEP